MSDWKKVVLQHMTQLNLPARTREEVIAELAAHLEDSECEACPDQTAASESIDAVPWQKLARAISRAKREEGIMNQRTRELWLPAMANLTVYTIMMYVGAFCFNETIWTPRISSGSHSPLPIFHPWLFMLPLCGAVGAVLAKRSEATRGTRVIVGLAPSLVWLAVFSIMGLAFVSAPSYFKSFPLGQVGLAAFGWIVVPGLLLLVGTVPFLRTRRAKA